jgi:DNA-binding SARP family transcriptional activator/ketosteroid isomerase-like protein
MPAKDSTAAPNVQLQQTAEDWFRHLETGTSDELRRLLTQDAVLLPPGGPSVTGREAVAEAAQAELGKAPQRLRFEVDEVRTSGELGFIRFRETREEGADNGDGNGHCGPRSQSRRGLFVAFREDDAWRLARLIGNIDGEGGPAQEGADPRLTPDLSGPGFKVALLGTPRVSLSKDLRTRVNGAIEVQWPLKKALKILVYLATSHEFEASREQLIDAVWTDEQEAKVEKNFHPTLSHLRRTLASYWKEALEERMPKPLLFVGGVYRLNPDIGWLVDTLELERLTQEGVALRTTDVDGCLAFLQTACELYRGPFLEGYYEPWTVIHRDRFQRLYLDMLRDMAEIFTEQGKLTDALDSYRRVLFEDPLRERVHVSLMKVYADLGRRDLVRRQYEKLSNLLNDELGVEPLPDTTSEFHRLMG